MHLLLIEDHADLAANIGEYLAARGHALDQLAREIADSHRGLIEAKSLNLVITTVPTSITALEHPGLSPECRSAARL